MALGARRRRRLVIVAALAALLAGYRNRRLAEAERQTDPG